MLEMANRHRDEEAGGYVNMAALLEEEDKGLVPELDYTESEVDDDDSELMGMDYVDLDGIATGAPVSGEGGPMWAAAAAAAAASGAAANPMLPESDEISKAASSEATEAASEGASHATSETQESEASTEYEPPTAAALAPAQPPAAEDDATDTVSTASNSTAESF